MAKNGTIILIVATAFIIFIVLVLRYSSTIYEAEPEVKARHYPTVIVIGSQKCGTTALMKFLSYHPDIASCMQEQHFFNTDNFKPIYWAYLKGMPVSFERQITIEKTPNYFTESQAPQRILEYQKFLGKKLKFILIVREPLRRSISNVYHAEHSGRLQVRNLTDILLKENNHFVDWSMYGKHFEHWLKYFPRDQFLVLDGEKMVRENPAYTTTKVESFLGLSHKLKKEDFAFNDEKGYYCYRPAAFCFPSNRGHASYPQDVTEDGKRFLKINFAQDQELFFRTIGQRFDWDSI